MKSNSSLPFFPEMCQKMSLETTTVHRLIEFILQWAVVTQSSEWTQWTAGCGITENTLKCDMQRGNRERAESNKPYQMNLRQNSLRTITRKVLWKGMLFAQCFSQTHIPKHFTDTERRQISTHSILISCICSHGCPGTDAQLHTSVPMNPLTSTN